MPKPCVAARMDLEQLHSELIDMLLSDAAAISHALLCENCGLRDTALAALSLANLDEVTWWRTLAERRG